MKKGVIFSCALIISLFLSGCANILSGGESENPLEYGTVKFVQSRGNFNVLDVEDIKFAKVSICGDGIQDEISVTVPVEGGIGSFEILRFVTTGQMQMEWCIKLTAFRILFQFLIFTKKLLITIAFCMSAILIMAETERFLAQILSTIIQILIL